MQIMHTKLAPLATRQKLSESILWHWQRRYFAANGIGAWSAGEVPHHVSTNPFMADAFAACVLGHLRDCAASADGGYDAGRPVYVLELGAGSGRLGYRLLRRLAALQRGARLQGMRVIYVMSDFAPATVAWWREHPWLAPFVEDGTLDFAQFDAEHDQELRLAVSGHCIDGSAPGNPMVVIANYVFDSLPQDAFQIEAGQLHELLATVSAPRREADLDDPTLLRRASVAFEARAIGRQHYPEPAWNTLLEQYRCRLPALAFTFPVAALRCIARLERIAGGKLLLLSADRGYHTDAALLEGQGAPQFSHHGSVSMLVDYQLLGAYAELSGGLALQPRHAHRSLCVSAFLFGGQAQDALETRSAFEQMAGGFGPDDFCTLKEGIERAGADFSPDELLAFLRLSRWDHLRLQHALPLLRARLGEFDDGLRAQFAQAAHLCWENYLPIGEGDDLAFEIGTLLLELELADDALLFFGYSEALFGIEPGSAFNMALCHASLGQREAALERAEQAIALDPALDAAKVLRLSLLAPGAGTAPQLPLAETES